MGSRSFRSLRMDEVLARAMTRKPEPIEWDETTTTAAAVPEGSPGRGGSLDAHRALNDREPESGMRVLSLGRSLQQLSPGAWSIELRPPRAVRRLRPQGGRAGGVGSNRTTKSSSSRSSCASRSSSWNPFDGWMFYLKSR